MARVEDLYLAETAGIFWESGAVPSRRAGAVVVVRFIAGDRLCRRMHGNKKDEEVDTKLLSFFWY